ncbi:small acidic protein family-domain-containing protein, partial [Thamnocephalis sphaerospora]
QQEEMKSKDGAAKKKSKKEKKEKSDKDAKKKKKKKEKKEKGKDKDGESSKASVESQRSEEAPVEARESASSAGGSSWNDWSQADFSGDAARKDKFMRLLGAKKAPAGGSTARKGLYGSLQAGTSGTAINSNVAQQMEQHMEQQFAAGIRARKDRFHGGPSGLGF